MDHKPTGAGKSSYELIDPDRLFAALALQEDTVFLDAACGRGAYSLAASRFIGPQGRIYAFDLWEQGIADLQREFSDRIYRATKRRNWRCADPGGSRDR